jgi:prolyl-tRNA editing enzyme YbaK/EbsC (Cys-tRNA(Pro) deacylase)
VTPTIRAMTMARDPAERAVLDHLDGLGASYRAIRIDPAFAQTARFCAEYGYDAESSGNCIVVASRTADPLYAACLVQATRRLDVNGTVRRLLGVRKASFAAADTTTQLTGMLPDGVTPFGLPPSLPLYVDAAIRALGRVIVGGGSRALKIEVATDVFARMPSARVVEGLAKP